MILSDCHQQRVYRQEMFTMAVGSLTSQVLLGKLITVLFIMK